MKSVCTVSLFLWSPRIRVLENLASFTLCVAVPGPPAWAIVMILSFRTDMPGQTVQTQIRLLLEEQSDQGLHCLPYCRHRLDSLLYGRATQFKF